MANDRRDDWRAELRMIFDSMRGLATRSPVPAKVSIPSYATLEALQQNVAVVAASLVAEGHIGSSQAARVYFADAGQTIKCLSGRARLSKSSSLRAPNPSNGCRSRCCAATLDL